ncbi:MAG: hypothetical protein AAF938_11015 [Myxococcota bacterium]
MAEREDSESSEGESNEEGSTNRIEGLFREAIRKAVEKGVEAGVGTFSKADRAVRGVASEVPLPREIAGYVFSQIDETKNALVRVVAGEVRDFLDATDMAGELQRALTSLSFEIKTEVRFIPNDAGGIRPSLRARPSVKSKRVDRDAEDSEESEKS